ncbi:MAG: hypothetical protein KatS3mg060_2286 [Dehalococcoidia bacterium]|nr:MAG: hypothetical protein KatS3mg060_2286 [Dehalococcoidia bacterium]
MAPGLQPPAGPQFACRHRSWRRSIGLVPCGRSERPRLPAQSRRTTERRSCARGRVGPRASNGSATPGDRRRRGIAPGRGVTVRESAAALQLGLIGRVQSGSDGPSGRGPRPREVQAMNAADDRTTHRARLKQAELASGVGAGILGAGLGALAAQYVGVGALRAPTPRRGRRHARLGDARAPPSRRHGAAGLVGRGALLAALGPPPRHCRARPPPAVTGRAAGLTVEPRC